jgi:hypothetical protein
MSAEHTGELQRGDWSDPLPGSARSGTPHTSRQPQQRRHSFDISLWRDLRDVSAGELRKHSTVSSVRTSVLMIDSTHSSRSHAGCKAEGAPDKAGKSLG